VPSNAQFSSLFKVALVTVATSFPVSAFADATYFAFSSTPSSWVGRGYVDYFVTPEMGWTFSAVSGSSGGDPDAISLRATNPQPTGFSWQLVLGATYGETLTPGFYEGATRFASDSNPGISVSGGGRGNNITAGYFNVLEAQFSPTGEVLRFAVDFRQYDEGNLSHWMDGKFRYNSTIPEPAALTLLCLGSIFLLRRR
jgi:hypothetical protein